MNRKQNINSQKEVKIVASLDDFDDEYDNKFKNPKKDTKNSKTPVLDSFSKDLTKMAEEGKIDPIVGREKEILRVSQILSRRKKNNPILIGEPGVGKSSIAEGLALRIVQRKVSRVLFNKRIVTLDLASMVAGTKYRGQFEERIKALMAELEKEPNIILFIDEIHTMIGAGGASGSLDASNMFKPALSRGELQIIGATTLDEYRKHIEKDGALERRFQKVLVEPATEEETLQILNNIKDNYENHHSVIFTPEALKACVTLTARYVQDRFLPDKAIDALDEAGSHVHISNINVPKEIVDIESEIAKVKEEKQSVVKSQRYEDAAKLRDKERQLNESLDKARLVWEAEQKKHRQLVTEENVAQVVSMITGIPLQKITTNENSKLSKMAPSLKGKVIGQDDAVNKIVRSIQRSRIGLADPNKPIFVGMLIGNSGVGKTELAKKLAGYMFDSEDSLIRLDMSEYMEKIAATRISGAAPGYVGYDEGSELLNKVITKPYSVILLDEIEKAHPDIYNLFLQVFDDGYMTDSHGRKVSFKNCVILMTSNVGTKEVKEFGTGVGFNTKAKEEKRSDNIKDKLEKELKKKFPPEFINRIDDIIYFKDLSKEDILSIIDLELVKSIKRTSEIGYEITIDDKLKEHLAKVGYDPQYGARPMKRAIQRWIDDYLTDFILENSPSEGTKLDLTYDSDKDSTLITATAPEKVEVQVKEEEKVSEVSEEKPKKSRKKKSE
jgi:ATP-dependent Clp protease ATP-binding subunit ClpC